MAVIRQQLFNECELCIICPPGGCRGFIDPVELRPGFFYIDSLRNDFTLKIKEEAA